MSQCLLCYHAWCRSLLLLGLALACLSHLNAAPAPAKTRINPKDGAVMIFIPAGDFLMGTSANDLIEVLQWKDGLKPEWFADEQPQHKVYLDGYWIYQDEVTIGQYRKFCTETMRKMPDIPKWLKADDTYPMVNASWDDAVAYTKWAGVRLPTEAEWEKAARGPDGRRFPWGNEWNNEKCNSYMDTNPIGGGFQGKRTTPAGTYPDSNSPYGVRDLAGNVWEWCQDWYAPDYYAYSPAKNPQGPELGEFHVLRGGTWGSSNLTVRSASRHRDSPDATYHDDGGFRCAAAESKQDR